eukprot:scaffold8189_cov107-Skeletonema_dohrnii-CCMP3373.AAC.10
MSNANSFLDNYIICTFNQDLQTRLRLDSDSRSESFVFPKLLSATYLSRETAQQNEEALPRAKMARSARLRAICRKVEMMQILLVYANAICLASLSLLYRFTFDGFI